MPSITEAIATSTAPSGCALVGATDWCTHPADLEVRGVRRVRGTKNPDLAAVRALEPDLVVTTKEENRELDVRRLRESGVPVWVTDIETVPAAVASLERLYDEALRWPRPAWLGQARTRWCGPLPPVTHTVAVPIWRDPWMVVGPRTFTSDLLRRLGLANVFNEPDEPDQPHQQQSRYPGTDPAGIAARRPDLVLLPDEPYVFTADDGPEAFAAAPLAPHPALPTRLVSGRLITWYGPSLVDEAMDSVPPGQ